MTIIERIDRGVLPECLEGGDPDHYRAFWHAPTWDGWLAAWRGIAWVRLQAFERDGEVQWAYEEYRKYEEAT